MLSIDNTFQNGGAEIFYPKLPRKKTHNEWEILWFSNAVLRNCVHLCCMSVHAHTLRSSVFPPSMCHIHSGNLTFIVGLKLGIISETDMIVSTVQTNRLVRPLFQYKLCKQYKQWSKDWAHVLLCILATSFFLYKLLNGYF